MAKPPNSKRIDSQSPTNSEPGGGEEPNQAVDQERIARLAYSYWEARGYQGGSAEEDWLRAESELTRQQAAITSRQPARPIVSQDQPLASRATSGSR